MNKKTIKKYAKEHKCSIREAQRQLGLKATGNISVLSSPKGEDIIKEEVFDINDKSWKSYVDGKEYFNALWGQKYLHYLIKGNRGLSKQITEEMMEFFLKSVVDIDPLQLPTRHDFSNGYYVGHIHGKYTVPSLDIIVNLFFPTGEQDTNTARLFLKYKDIIKRNNHMTYLLLVSIYQRNPSHVDLEEFNDIAMKLTLEERLRLSTYGLHSTVDKDHNDYMEELNGEETYVYRTFRVRKGESIRKGVTKLNNLDWNIHQEGKGSSYSISKVRAITVAHWLHKSMLEKYGKGSMKDMTRFLYFYHNSLGNVFENPMQLQDDVYCAVGLFKIKKSNVIGATNSMGEDEIIIHPKNVELIDYKFLNIIDFISQWFVFRCQTSVKFANVGLGEVGREDFLNEEGWYDICYDYLIHNVDDDFINEFIQVYNGTYDDRNDLCQKLLEMIFGDGQMEVIKASVKRTNHKKFALGYAKEVIGGTENTLQTVFRPEIPKPSDPKSIRPKTGLYKSVA